MQISMQFESGEMADHLEARLPFLHDPVRQEAQEVIEELRERPFWILPDYETHWYLSRYGAPAST